MFTKIITINYKFYILCALQILFSTISLSAARTLENLSKKNQYQLLNYTLFHQTFGCPPFVQNPIELTEKIIANGAQIGIDNPSNKIRLSAVAQATHVACRPISQSFNAKEKNQHSEKIEKHLHTLSALIYANAYSKETEYALNNLTREQRVIFVRKCGDFARNQFRMAVFRISGVGSPSDRLSEEMLDHIASFLEPAFTKSLKNTRMHNIWQREQKKKIKMELEERHRKREI